MNVLLDGLSVLINNWRLITGILVFTLTILFLIDFAGRDISGDRPVERVPLRGIPNAFASRVAA
jgi:hypothetical protein